jgi:hypothetical protein
MGSSASSLNLVPQCLRGRTPAKTTIVAASRSALRSGDFSLQPLTSEHLAVRPSLNWTMALSNVRRIARSFAAVNEVLSSANYARVNGVRQGRAASDEFGGSALAVGAGRGEREFRPGVLLWN